MLWNEVITSHVRVWVKELQTGLWTVDGSSYEDPWCIYGLNYLLCFLSGPLRLTALWCPVQDPRKLSEYDIKSVYVMCADICSKHDDRNCFYDVYLTYSPQDCEISVRKDLKRSFQHVLYFRGSIWERQRIHPELDKICYEVLVLNSLLGKFAVMC